MTDQRHGTALSDELPTATGLRAFCERRKAAAGTVELNPQVILDALDRAEAVDARVARLEAASKLAETALDNALRSAGSSVAGFIATRKLMAKAQAAARQALAGSPDPVRDCPGCCGHGQIDPGSAAACPLCDGTGREIDHVHEAKRAVIEAAMEEHSAKLSVGMVIDPNSIDHDAWQKLIDTAMRTEQATAAACNNLAKLSPASPIPCHPPMPSSICSTES